MVSQQRTGLRLLSASIGLMTLAVTTPGSAGVTSSTEMHDYRVTGTNADGAILLIDANAVAPGLFAFQ